MNKSFCSLVILFVCMSNVFCGNLKVGKMFGDHMVLQQELPVAVWGTADAGSKVMVKFQGQSKEATTDKDGKWILRLDPLKIGKPGELVVNSGDDKVSFKDVLVGEVWVGSGQSNMAGRVGSYAKNDPVLKTISESGPYPEIRLYNKRSGKWSVANAKTIPGFSAIHFSFGYALQKELKVPVGLMYSAVGGRPSGNFITEEMLKADPAAMALLAKSGKSIEGIREEGIKIRELQKKTNQEYQEAVKKAKAAGTDPKKIKRIRHRGPCLIGELYTNGVSTFVPYTIRGVLWDQGEARTQVPGVDQYTLMNALIKGWRKDWEHGDFYFLHVQKPSGGGVPWNPEDPMNSGAMKFNDKFPKTHYGRPSALNYPLAHVKMGTLKNAPLVTAVDLGPNTHPTCKSGYGKRASIVALGTAYKRDIPVCGPVYKSHKVDGATIRVSFDHIGSGLSFKHADTIRGFEIAGADGKWEWAEAKIDGNDIILSHEKVKAPVMVQYAFHKYKNFANLYNKEGCPLMFTTKKEEPKK